MRIALIVFMVLSGLVCIFSIVVMVRDIIIERKSKQEQEEAPAPAPVPAIAAPTVVAAPVLLNAYPAPEVQDEVEAEESDLENEIVFSASEQKTLDEKFQELDEQQQRYYVEIVQYAMGQEGAKQFKNSRYEEYKIGKPRLVRLQIKRGIVVCEFILFNTDFNNYIRSNKVRVKQAPTVLRIEDEAAVAIAKNSIDIAVRAAAEDMEYKKQLRREKRKLARQQSRAQAEAQADEQQQG